MEKPIECSNCKKENTIEYTECSLEGRHCFGMCESCPVLQKKLYGGIGIEDHALVQYEAAKDITCGKCHNTLFNVLEGQDMGCNTCYEVFAAPLEEWLEKEHRVYSDHKGRFSAPFLHKEYSAVDVDTDAKIANLQSKLKEAIRQEQYEKAAQLRDEISQIKEERS